MVAGRKPSWFHHGNELSRAAFRARAWYFCHGTSQDGLLSMRTRITPLIENAGAGLHARIGGKQLAQAGLEVTIRNCPADQARNPI